MLIWIAVCILLLIVADKAISYYGMALGLLYYLGTRHNDLLSAEKAKELRDAALKRRIAEILRKD